MQLTDDALERVLHFLVWREADYQTCLEVTAKVSQQWARVSQLTRLRHSLTLYVDDQSKAADLVNLLGSGRHRLQARISYLLSQIHAGSPNFGHSIYLPDWKKRLLTRYQEMYVLTYPYYKYDFPCLVQALNFRAKLKSLRNSTWLYYVAICYHLNSLRITSSSQTLPLVWRLSIFSLRLCQASLGSNIFVSCSVLSFWPNTSSVSSVAKCIRNILVKILPTSKVYCLFSLFCNEKCLL